ncbi:hypothetical protein CLG94_09425 [Candidatus Methylomirabilis limnetica]|uniref:Uncharacterized protein n=1 Tax=Candidatus Methylomirabilis limnetica TaxID=2033718 RepID=A0A2T4TWK1_9BACT|nr:hypothetical protein [Candidatus Methylomirabilis limnetica]PTL35480.1 hypothetical protein CLG94_09425 [Candidatus Methylomirabilis limnetica]
MRNLGRKVRDETKLSDAMQLVSAALVIMLAVMTTAIHTAYAFAPAGAKATLSVDYVYESVGKKQDINDLREWRSKRSVSLVADLASQSPTPLPTMQALDAAQTAELDKQAGQMGKMVTEMAPMTADIGKIMAKCGGVENLDEKCMEREIKNMGTALAGTKKGDAMIKTGKETAQAVQPGASRYQVRYATAQKGSYAIDETAHSVLADPICQPTLRCTRNQAHKGSGTVPPRSATARDVGLFYAVEVDTAKNTLTVALPVPLLPLPYTETITTNEPDGARDTPTPKGPQPKQLVFRTSADGNNKPFTVALKGGCRSQAGEQVVVLKGEFGDAGIAHRTLALQRAVTAVHRARKHKIKGARIKGTINGARVESAGLGLSITFFA